MLPEAFSDRMRRTLGDEYEGFLKALEGERHQALRLNVLKPGPAGKTAVEILAGPGRKTAVAVLAGPAGRNRSEEPDGEVKNFFSRLTPVPWAENGYYYETGMQPGKHPYHQAGLYYIQEPSAMAPAELLCVSPGERVLDLCAAPGGKSTQLAAKLKGKGLLICNEIHPARAKILSENVERMGIRNACVTNETPERLCTGFSAYFDKILVDAPCSGEGMFRKNEAACEEWSPENVMLCAARQDEILDCAAQMLRPGGRLVYSTCTFAAEEDEGSVERFLNSHPDFRLVPVDTEKTGLQGCEGEIAGTIKLMPHKVRGEGHFAAVLERDGAVPDGWRGSTAGGGFKRIPEKELEDYLSFCRENLRCVPRTAASLPEWGGKAAGNDRACFWGGEYNACCVRFGDNIYLVPEEMPDLKGLKVLRPGLHLGELKKNRFEPSHALALALSPEEAIHVLNLSADELTVSAYLNGRTFPAGGEKGWYLICVDGFSLGWGKQSGGIMKNHYPRGLRVNL